MKGGGKEEKRLGLNTPRLSSLKRRGETKKERRSPVNPCPGVEALGRIMANDRQIRERTLKTTKGKEPLNEEKGIQAQGAVIP